MRGSRARRLGVLNIDRLGEVDRCRLGSRRMRGGTTASFAAARGRVRRAARRRSSSARLMRSTLGSPQPSRRRSATSHSTSSGRYRKCIKRDRQHDRGRSARQGQPRRLRTRAARSRAASRSTAAPRAAATGSSNVHVRCAAHAASPALRATRPRRARRRSASTTPSTDRTGDSGSPAPRRERRLDQREALALALGLEIPRQRRLHLLLAHFAILELRVLEVAQQRAVLALDRPATATAASRSRRSALAAPRACSATTLRSFIDASRCALTWM